METKINIKNNIKVEADKIGNSHYYMNYFSDYGFNEYLSNGVSNLDECIDFINQTRYIILSVFGISN